MLVHFLKKSATDFSRHQLQSLEASDAMVDYSKSLDAATDWLMRSIDACDGQASSKSYRLLRGWMPPYPETSGYIIPTLLMLNRHTGQPTYEETANRVSNWLTSIQLENGGFRGREIGSQSNPDVFDTGMILLGFNAILSTNDNEHIWEAAWKASNFLRSAIDETGCFSKHISHDQIHTYNVRAAWGLLAFATLSCDPKLKEYALKNANWTLRQQNESGFFLNNAFKPGGNANTHGLAYVLRALLQIYELTGQEKFLRAVRKSADNISTHYRQNGWLSAEVGPSWEYLSSYICLTGYAQLAIVFDRLSVLTGEKKYQSIATRLINFVALCQNTESESKPYYGGVPGSFPIYGRYAPFQYPNWATKFLIDCLALRKINESERVGKFRFLLYSG
jgi:uncharacterized protein YyaL (SSP411 family)